MFTKDQEKIIKKLGLSKQDIYSLFVSKEFLIKHKLQIRMKSDAPDGIVVKASNGKKDTEFFGMVYIFCKNGIEIFCDGFYLPKELQNQGIRTKCFDAQIKIAHKLGYKLLTSKCSRSEDKVEFGYIVGPRLGYNGLYKSKKLELLKKNYCKEHTFSKKETKEIMDANDVLDLFSSAAGYECRKEIGWTFDAEFDLSKNSKSMKTFKKHLNKYV